MGRLFGLWQTLRSAEIPVPTSITTHNKGNWVLWLGEPKDSIDRFTISHSRFTAFHDGDTSLILGRHNSLKNQLLSNPENPPIIFDTTQKINDRYYSIMAMGKSNGLKQLTLIAVTTIMSNEIKFKFELLTAKGDSITNSFIRNSMDALKTIRIEKGI